MCAVLCVCVCMCVRVYMYVFREMFGAFLDFFLLLGRIATAFFLAFYQRKFHFLGGLFVPARLMNFIISGVVFRPKYHFANCESANERSCERSSFPHGSYGCVSSRGRLLCGRDFQYA